MITTDKQTPILGRRHIVCIGLALSITSLLPVASAYGRLFWPYETGLVPRRHYLPSRRFDLMSDIFSMPVYMNSLFRQTEAEFARMEKRMAQPNYELIDRDDHVELAMDLPGVRTEDITVQLEENGSVLRVKGSRQYGHEEKSVQTNFERMFTIDQLNVDVDQIAVTMSDGVLRITAPKMKSKVAAVRRIPIASLKEETEKNGAGAEGEEEPDQPITKERVDPADDFTITEEDL